MLFSAFFLPTEHARIEKSQVIKPGQTCSNPLRNRASAMMHGLEKNLLFKKQRKEHQEASKIVFAIPSLHEG